jgi:hypothetical protein
MEDDVNALMGEVDEAIWTLEASGSLHYDRPDKV